MGITSIIVLVIIAAVVIWFISAYNNFVKLSTSIDEAFATMDVYLKKRYDLIPNLVETVKGYAKHESETLNNVVKARSAIGNAKTTDEKVENENALSGTLKSLFAVAEAYPDLKANTNFQELMTQLKSVENDIANARKYYNAIVKKYNISVKSFPSVIVANLFHYNERTMFEVSEANERENVKVSF